MAQFTLQWDNNDIVSNSNATGERLLYRYKSVGGNFITIGDVSKSVVNIDTEVLNDNKIIEIKAQCLCTENGPSDNDNGVQEVIGFSCIIPNIVKTETTSSITLNTTGTDITKVAFTLRKSNDNTVVLPKTVINVVSNSASIQKTNLTNSTNYYWQIELYAIVNNTEVISSSADFIGSICSPYPFQTDAPAVCNPITSLTVVSIEVL